MTLWKSITIVLLFSFLVIGVDELFHWRRRQRKLREQGASKKPS